MQRKIISYITAFLIFVSAGVVSADKVSAREKIADYKLEMLNSVGILKNMYDYTEGAVTRLEGAETVLKILAADADNRNTRSKFIDVEDFTYESAVSAAADEYGFMQGIDGRFYPNKILTFNQAVKILVIALGYGDYAEAKGGYPNGYRRVASDIGLLAGITSGAEEGITQDAFYSMVYNAAEISVADITGIENDDKIYSTDGNKTFLEKYHNIFYVRGIVSANEKTASGSRTAAAKSRIRVNGSEYEEGLSGAGEYIGFDTEMYIKKYDSAEVVLWARPHDRNKTAQILCRNINSFENKILSEKKDGKEKKYKISEVADVIYNGKYIANPEEFNLIPSVGFVNIIDNNGDGVYDYYIVTDYITYRVRSIDDTHMKIYDRFFQPKIDFFDESNIIKITKNGENAGFEDIENGDILLVAADKVNFINGCRYIGDAASVFEIIITSDKISGEIQSFSEKSGEEILKIGGEEYVLSQELKKLIELKKATEPTVGNSYDFYLGTDNIIIDISASDSSFFYGYLYMTKFIGGIDEEYRIKYYDVSTSNWAEKTVCEKTVLNGIYSDTSTVDTAFKTDKDGSIKTDTVKQLFKFKINDKGEINYIDTWIYNEMYEDYETSLRLSVKKQTFTKRNSPVMSELFYVGENAVILNVPMVTKNGVTDVSDDASLFSVTGRSALGYYNDYTAEAYNCNTVGVSNMIVIYNTIMSDISTAIIEGRGLGYYPAMIESIVKCSIEGETYNRIYAYNSTGEVSFILRNDAMITDCISQNFSQIDISSLKCGDIIRFDMLDSMCVRIERVFSPETNSGYNKFYYVLNNWQSVNAKFRLGYGIACEYENNVMKIKFDKDMTTADNFSVIDVSSMRVPVYDSENSTVYLTDTGNITCAGLTMDTESANEIVFATDDMKTIGVFAYK